MRCLACNAEMRVEEVTPDETSPVWGYEHRTLRCPECGDVERRLAFAGDKGSPEAGPPRENVAIGAPTSGTPTSPPIAEAQSDAADEPPEKVPAVKWAQAVEKVRMRHTVLALQVAAQRTADAAVSQSLPPSHDFDRIWENLVPPGGSPPSSKPASLPRLELAPAKEATPTPAPRIVALPPIEAPIVPATSPPPTSAPAVVDAKAATAAEPHPFQSAWTRALALLRRRQERVEKVERPDAILRIDTDALRVMPRNRPTPKPSSRPARPR
jgi:hypothetical protein